MKEFETIEQTFTMIKPDGLKRSLVGKIIKKFEEAGLKLVAARMIMASVEKAKSHYPGTKEWLQRLGVKSLESYDNDSKRLKEHYGTDDLLKVGQIISDNLIKLLTNGPIILMVWEGNHAVDEVRQIGGATIPRFAGSGTIRGDWGNDSPPLAVKSGRIVSSNLIHISESKEEAQREIKHWFGDEYKYLGDYDRVDLGGLFDESW